MAELKSGDYDKELARHKAEHLLEKSMITDCYYYLGRMASESLAGRGDAFFSKYAKLVQISMDLSSDIQELEKLQKAACSGPRKRACSYFRAETVSTGASALTVLARSFALYFRFLGFVRSLYPQHGHQRPSHFMNISQIWHLFWPEAYLPEPTGF